MKLTPFFRWYDLWIGDTAKRTIYICPVPMFGLKVEFPKKRCPHDRLTEGYYGFDCAACGELIYPYGQEPWNVPTDDEQARIDREEYAATHWTCETCGGEFGDGWTTCRCEVER